MAITSIDIDTELLRLAKESFGVRTNRETITLALRDVVMRQRQLQAIDVIAQLPVDRDARTVSYGS